ncbi:MULTISPECIES: TetR/AcrR family transcriptional regulator [unclassified Salinicola]|uniref:TetR/AcrR family transcriptional regulator n=1 Tax=unclassified Salinicola TaxID=2634022 RepID=UPI001A906DE4|nr:MULTISPECIES: TetR/AcrR family transcriptional regulator [unclassified Salinicola]MCE3028100.1 TetR/AcrR family transcriptional regulator [Salinicola sp. DM10]WIX32662.1 TetR/AcrR family transcriptional regulator [Salinicola sp. JS01]
MSSVEDKKRRVRKTREERRSEILDAATKVFVDEGYAELTLRRIAKEVDIRLSTVQHYFESRESIIKTLIYNRVQTYLSNHAALKEEVTGSGEDKVRAIFKSLVEDSLNVETCRFFTQMWAMGFQSDIFRDQLFEMYDCHREDIAEVIALVRPDLSPTERFQRATMISSMIEGSLIHLGVGLPSDDRLNGVRERMLEVLVNLAKT